MGKLKKIINHFHLHRDGWKFYIENGLISISEFCELTKYERSLFKHNKPTWITVEMWVENNVIINTKIISEFKGSMSNKPWSFIEEPCEMELKMGMFNN